MCIAIFKPEGKIIDKAILEECYSCNRDGAGFAFFNPNFVPKSKVPEEEGPLFYHKGFFSFEDFYADYQKYQHNKCLIHFRIATHKNVNGENCHPWRVNKDLVFIHNGSISGMTEDDTLSDTGNFRNMLAELLRDDPEYYKTPEFEFLVTNVVGSNNKLIFMDSQGWHLIINPSAGKFEDGGVWMSNTSYLCDRARKTGILTDEFYPKKEDKPILQLTNSDKTTNSNLEGKKFSSADYNLPDLKREIEQKGFAILQVFDGDEGTMDKILEEINS